jgi:hypothetical protein
MFRSGVERGGLAGAGRPGHQQDAVRPVDQVVHLAQMIVAKADVGQVVQHRLAIEETDGDALALLHRRDGGDAHVDVLAGDLAANASVLRKALLGDVQAGHDLHTRDDRRHELARGAAGLVELAVDAVAHLDLFLARLDVDIAGALLDRVEQQRVDPADDRRLVGDLEDVDQLLAGAGHLVLVLTLGAEIAALVLLAAVDLVDDLEDLLRRHQHRLDLRAQLRAQIVQRADLQRIGDRDRDDVVLLADRQQAVLLGESDRHVRDQLQVDLVRLQLGAIADAQLLAQRLLDLLLGHRAHPHQDFAEPAALDGLHLQPLLEKLGGQTRARGRFRLQQNLSNQFRAQVLSLLLTVLSAARSPAAPAVAATPAVAAAASRAARWAAARSAARSPGSAARVPAPALSTRPAPATRSRPSDRSPASRECPARLDPLPRRRARRG